VIRAAVVLIANLLLFAVLFAVVFRTGLVPYMIALVLGGVTAAVWTRRVSFIVGPAAAFSVLAFALVMWSQAAVDNQPVHTPMSDGFVALLQWPNLVVAGGIALVTGCLALVGWVAGSAVRTLLVARRSRSRASVASGAVEQ
jgi:hypothetical protein